MEKCKTTTKKKITKIMTVAVDMSSVGKHPRI